MNYQTIYYKIDIQKNTFMKEKIALVPHNYLLYLILLISIYGYTQLQAQNKISLAHKIVSQMTLQEKIKELHGMRDSVHLRYVPPIPKLHIPELRIANGPAGVGPADEVKQLPATAMSAPISLAATWDIKLAHKYGVIIGSEAKDLRYGLLEAPDVNIARVPQCGRTFEAFGEDPFLTAQIAVYEIKGIQSQGIIANVKHYLANNQEARRLKINETISERALREIYLPAFEASVKEGNAASVMAAYNKINGVYCCENSEFLDSILKKEWDFKGFVTSDFGAVHSTIPSALAGLDLEMPTGKYFSSELESAVNSGKVPLPVIDDKLFRRFNTMMEFGLFDHPMKPKIIPTIKDGKESLRISEEGIVLLKNSGNELPLNPAKLKNIAVIGPYAEKAMTGGGGSSHVIPLYTVDPVEGIKNKVGSNVKINFADGSDMQDAIRLAKSSDAAIVMVGDSENEGQDHQLKLSGNQNQLVNAIADANPHTVVVLKTGSAVLMPWVNKVAAILEAWYPGEEDGNAVAAILFGEVNPSGKLPLTFPKRIEDLPANTSQQYPGIDDTAKYSEGIFVGYRHYDKNNIQPLFPFGYGLSYTTFTYKNLKINRDNFSLEKNSKRTITITFEITNNGNRSGKEIAEVYLCLPSMKDIPQPPKQLKAFTKILLKAGQTNRVSLSLEENSLRCWDTNTHSWRILPGKYHIMVGSSSRDIHLENYFEVLP